MLNSRTERKAIYTTANYFTEIGWFFREQPILDFGIDAFVEVGESGRPSGNFIALQIKGGKSNFHKTKKGLTFYFDETHYQYWLEVNKTFPVFIIIQDPTDNKLYWKSINKENSIQTKKNWKVIIPFSNELKNSSKELILNILFSHKNSSSYKSDYIHLAKNIDKEKAISFFEIENHSKLGLQIILNYDNKPKKINLNYKPKKSDWDNNKKELIWNHSYYYTISDTINYLLSFNTGNKKIETAIDKIENQINSGGISKLVSFLFDWKNEKNDIPKYSYFVEAIEYFLKTNGYNEKSYELQAIDEFIYFNVGNEKYIINTYDGKIEELKFLIENKAYSEIYTMTDENIWSEIYLDAGISKTNFIPKMLNLWEKYWDDIYIKIEKELGTTNHLDKPKEKSWRQFQIFSDNYTAVGDIIKYAYALNDLEIYPLTVVTMMNIFNADICYFEYCEYEFESGYWESICVDYENEKKPVFYVKRNEE